MNWSQLLEKIILFKQTCETGQLNISAGGMTTLLYAGCFDSIIDLPKPIQWNTYKELTEQLKSALGSEAMLPKARKNEALGIADIDSDIKLNLWRYQANPIHKFSLAEHFKGFMQAEGFKKTSGYEKKMIFFRPEPDTQSGSFRHRVKRLDIWDSWKYIFDNNAAFKAYSTSEDEFGNKKYPASDIGFLGMLQDVKEQTLKNGKQSFTFKLFLGGETTDEIRVWSNDQGVVPYAIRQHLKNGNVGVGIVRLQKYNDRPSGSLSEWIPAGKWQST